MRLAVIERIIVGQTNETIPNTPNLSYGKITRINDINRIENIIHLSHIKKHINQEKVIIYKQYISKDTTVYYVCIPAEYTDNEKYIF